MTNVFALTEAVDADAEFTNEMNVALGHRDMNAHGEQVTIVRTGDSGPIEINDASVVFQPLVGDFEKNAGKSLRRSWRHAGHE